MVGILYIIFLDLPTPILPHLDKLDSPRTDTPIINTNNLNNSIKDPWSTGTSKNINLIQQPLTRKISEEHDIRISCKSQIDIKMETIDWTDVKITKDVVRGTLFRHIEFSLVFKVIGFLFLRIIQMML